MALARKCDICRQYFDHGDAAKRNAICFGKTSSTGCLRTENAKDACPECIKAIEKCLEECKNRPVIRECQ